MELYEGLFAGALGVLAALIEWHGRRQRRANEQQHRDHETVATELRGMRADVREVRGEQREVRDDIRSMRAEQTRLDRRMVSMETGMGHLDSRLTRVEGGVFHVSEEIHDHNGEGSGDDDSA